MRRAVRSAELALRRPTAAHAQSLLIAVGVGGALLLSSYRCPIHAVTGWYCPGCGGTRALGALLRGDVVGALRDNLFALTLFPLAIAVAVLKPERITDWLDRHRTAVFVVAAMLTVGFTLARNTIAPWLAPVVFSP